jgi:transposase
LALSGRANHREGIAEQSDPKHCREKNVVDPECGTGDRARRRIAQGSHKANAVRRAIRAAGAWLFYMPKYSPDLNPIEQFFAKFKHWLRKAAQRTTEAVYQAIEPILKTVSPTECAN